MKIVNLSELNWELVGTKPYSWKMFGQIENMEITHPEDSTIPAKVPGSVQQSLLNAGIIPDWNIGTNSRDCEWVENRHWIYFLNIPDRLVEKSKNIRLRCKGLDDNGEIWLNGKKIGEFNNTHLEYVFSLNCEFKETENRLAILFKSPEQYLGQIYRTSLTRLNKPRYYYGWDWCPRIVQIGIWDDVLLEIDNNDSIEILYSNAGICEETGLGTLKLSCETTNELYSGSVKVKLSDKNRNIVLDKLFDINELINGIELNELNIEYWYPNGLGEQNLYELICEYMPLNGSEPQIIYRKIGFRKVEWLSCEGASENADKWLLTVNDKSIFMQGVNWTPIRALFADVTRDQYAKWLDNYKNLGVNLLRIWGGATIEKECFYELCDQMGLMVWQEFPISASGLDSTPPDDRIAVKTMSNIVESYIKRRHYHPSLIAWSGGNELYNQENTKPLDFSHPILKCAKDIVDKIDPKRRMMPASPSGPTRFYDPELNGKGVQWDVHGPWYLPYEPSDDKMSNIREFWAGSDALFHSEAGVAGASSAQLINKYKGQYPSMPATVENPLWAQFSWWIDWDNFKNAHNNDDPDSLEDYVEWQQNRQATALSVAVEEAKKKYPRCGGFLVWMGHDAFPCTANTSIIDFEGELKPAAKALKLIWNEP